LQHTAFDKANSFKQKSENFLSLKVKELLKRLREDGKDAECKTFATKIQSVYQRCIDYLEKWMTPFDDFQCFQRMFLNTVKNSVFDDLLPCVHYLNEKGVSAYDVQLFDQNCNLKSFAGQKDEQYFDSLLHEQWCSYFQSCANENCFSELLKICKFFFCIPGHNANVERAFSLINAQWTKDRNRLSVDSVRGILLTKYNLKKLSCVEFHAYVSVNNELLRKVASSKKYETS